MTANRRDLATMVAEGLAGRRQGRIAADLATDRARVAQVRKDWTTAIALLDRRSDREREPEVQPGHAPAASLGGFMLPMVSTWLAEAGR